MNADTLFTIGHSNRQLDEFIELLQLQQITAIADVRSHPSSRFAPHFNQEALQATLLEHRIEYVFLGKELGARRDEAGCYVDGVARYDLIEQAPLFRAGLDRIRKGAAKFRIALMCSERDPLTCHRSILIARSLRCDFQIRHIVSNDEPESHEDAEQRLLAIWGLPARALFHDENGLLDEAYARQAREIAWATHKSDQTTEGEM